MRHPQKNFRSSIVARLLAMVLLLSGCAAPSALYSESPADQNNANTRQMPDRQAAPKLLHHQTSGSLWVDDGALGTMFINAKARNVGDIVTVKIVETSSASNKASTDTDRTTAMSVGLTNFFNLEDKFPSTAKFFNPFTPVQSDYASEFEGSGTTVRSGALEAYISARIVQILPNGDFFIEGNREVRVNNENQVIVLLGERRHIVSQRIT